MVSKDQSKKNGLSKIQNSNGGDDSYDKIVRDVPDDKVLDEMFALRATRHADDAVDYEDIDELADDDLPIEEEAIGGNDDDDELDNIFDNDNDISDSRNQIAEDEEQRLQNNANDEFDGFFGDDVNMDVNPLDMHDENLGSSNKGRTDNSNDFFNQLDHTTLLHDDHDGLTDLNMGIFDDDQDKDESETDGGHISERKHKLEEAEVKQMKKRKLERIVNKLEASLNKKKISYYFPDYKKDKSYNNYFLSVPTPLYYNPQRPQIALKENIKPLIPTKLSLKIDVDQKKAFKSRKVAFKPNDLNNNSGIVSITNDDLKFIDELGASIDDVKSKLKPITLLRRGSLDYDRFSDFNKDLILSTTDWNDDAIINAGDTKTKEKLTKPLSKLSDRFLNTDYDYDDESIFSGQIASENFKLDMNDPNLLFISDRNKSQRSKSRAIIPINQKLLEMKFNVSNDKQYEILKNNYNTKVRSQLSNLSIEHSIPALRLQTPYYKVKLNKDEARAFHRPKLNVRPGSLISFSKLKIRKRKKDRGKSSQEVFSKTGDLTATDNGLIIGMEYAEEYPHILSNFGMGSKLINYYRKEKEDDNSRPKAPVGETHVLGVEDKSPFWNFGYVAKGDFVPTLYNNMLRAPIFKHDPKNTDFLLIRSQGAGNHQKHYLRPINHLFAVGHTFPAVEVPAPHSRKVTNTFKNRLKMVVYRTMNKNGVARVSVKDISQHFPDQNDMQNRQRLKEFMEYQRHGDDQGFWKIRNSSVVPSEEKIRSMITPEDASLLDSMQHGQQSLDDINAIYNEDSRKEEVKKDSKKDKSKDDDNDKENEAQKEKETEKPKKGKDKDKDKDKDDKDGEEDVDEELTPWNSSRNFLNSNQTKAMLQLNGEGDPTGIGLGFSFLRSTQKNTFQPYFPQPKENIPKSNTATYQQKLYEAEISRIWYGQRRSLTVAHQEGHTLDDIYDEYKPLDHAEYLQTKIANEKEDKRQKLASEGGKPQPNVLRITRRFRDSNNIVQRKTEIVNDPRLIKAYIQRKKQIEGDKMSMADVGDIIPTNDIEVNKIRKKALEDKIASLQKRAKLSKGRKSTAKDPLYAAQAAGGTIIDANTVMLPDGSYAIGGKGIGKGKSTTRRCKSCGAFGHIRTNKSCPLYYQTKGGTIPASKELKELVTNQATGVVNKPPEAQGDTSAVPSTTNAEGTS